VPEVRDTEPKVVPRIETPVVISACATRYCPRLADEGALVIAMSKSTPVKHGIQFLACVLMGAGLAACGSSEPEEGSTLTPAANKHTGSKPASAKGDMVAAVGAKTGAGAVDLRFSILSRPKVGEPVDIELALTPSVELEHLFARFQVTDGLQLVAGQETEHIEHPTTGVAVTHKVTVIPKSDGIFSITAVVLADSAKDSIARNFNIPIIAGQGLTELPSPSAAPPAASVADPQRAPARP
jgi:hypothetical protein